MAGRESRRDFLKRTSGLIVGFTLSGVRPSAGAPLTLGPYGPPDDEIDSWLVIGEDGSATLYSGCCELGTGSSTGLLQIMAEELDLPFGRTKLVGPDTNRTPDQFVSSGSRTISVHGRPIRQAAAEARQALLNLAAERLGVPVDQLVMDDGAVHASGAPGQWSRADENGWEALKGARVSDLQGGLDSKGNIVSWDARTFGFSGYSRPEYHEPKHGGEPGSQVTAELAGWTEPGLEEGYSGAAGNFTPIYALANRRWCLPILGPTLIAGVLCAFVWDRCAGWVRRITFSLMNRSWTNLPPPLGQTRSNSG